jgi:hypothetical protein
MALLFAAVFEVRLKQKRPRFAAFGFGDEPIYRD